MSWKIQQEGQADLVQRVDEKFAKISKINGMGDKNGYYISIAITAQV